MRTERVADRKYCEKQFERIANLVSHGVVEEQLRGRVGRSPTSSASRRARRRRASPGARATREAAEAAVREAEARRDLARARSRIARDPDATKRYRSS